MVLPFLYQNYIYLQITNTNNIIKKIIRINHFVLTVFFLKAHKQIAKAIIVRYRKNVTIS